MGMKKYSILAVLLLAVSALSCNKAEIPASVPEEEITVSYNVSLDNMTKAIGKGETVNYVWYATYKAIENDGVVTYILKSDPKMEPIVEGNAECSVAMVRNQSYKVVFLAQYYDDNNVPAYSILENTARLSMPAAPAANSDNYDLFGFTDTVVDFHGFGNKSAELTRRVAQLNFTADAADLSDAQALGKTPESSAVKLTGVPQYLYLLDWTTSSETMDVNYSKAPLTGTPNELATVFSLSGSQGNDVNASLYIYKGNEKIKEYTSIADVPTQANYRTNLKVSYTF